MIQYLYLHDPPLGLLYHIPPEHHFKKFNWKRRMSPIQAFSQQAPFTHPLQGPFIKQKYLHLSRKGTAPQNLLPSLVDPRRFNSGATLFWSLGWQKLHTWNMFQWNKTPNKVSILKTKDTYTKSSNHQFLCKALCFVSLSRGAFFLGTKPPLNGQILY